MKAVFSGNARWRLSLECLTKAYSDNVLFENLNLEFRPGMAVHVKGPNGAGKTQLMLVIAGLIESDSGRMVFHGSEEICLNRLNPETRAQFTRYVPYLPGLLAQLPVDRALLVLSRHLHSFSLHSQSTAAATIALESAPELQAICGHKVDFNKPFASHSVGEQKRIMAMASVSFNPYPALAMLDEPLAGLDSQGIARTIELMREVKSRGISLLVSEHRSEIFDFEFDQVLQLPYRANQPARAETMKSALPHRTNTGVAPAQPVLRISGVLAGYIGGPVYCSGLSVAAGELVLIQGPNGSGKTSFIRGLLGQPGTMLSGTVEFNNRQVANLKSAQQTNSVRYLSQGRNLFPDLTVRESVNIAGRGHTSEIAEEIEEIVRFLGPSKQVSHLSSGGRALLGLAQTVALTPLLIILDEPTANTDTDNRRRIWRLIEKICHHGGTAVLVIEHGDIPEWSTAVYQVRHAPHAGGPASLNRL